MNELSFATALASLLASYGSAKHGYITAEMQPFSNQQRPDLIFTPNKGSYAGQTIFLEIKLTTKPKTDAHAFKAIVESKQFASEAIGSNIALYIYITSGDVPDFSRKFLQDHRIHVVANVESADEVFRELKRLSVIA